MQKGRHNTAPEFGFFDFWRAFRDEGTQMSVKRLDEVPILQQNRSLVQSELYPLRHIGCWPFNEARSKQRMHPTRLFNLFTLFLQRTSWNTIWISRVAVVFGSKLSTKRQLFVQFDDLKEIVADVLLARGVILLQEKRANSTADQGFGCTAKGETVRTIPESYFAENA
jgi:hypothetical protein